MALRLALCFGNTTQFWRGMQSQYDIAIVEREHGAEIKKRVHPADVA
jgi:antitoxin HigA-1